MFKTALFLLGMLPSVLRCDSISLPVAVYQQQLGFGIGNPDGPPPTLLYNVTSPYPPTPIRTTSTDVTSFITNPMLSKATASIDLTASNLGKTAYSTFASEELSLSNPQPPNPEGGSSVIYSAGGALASYYVEVQEIRAPPTVIDFVPVIVTAKVSADCSGVTPGTRGISYGSSTATVEVFGSQTYNWIAACNGVTTPLHVGSTSSATALFGVQKEVIVKQNSLISNLDTVAEGGTASAVAAAMTDPTFEIDPSFPFASYYELVFSDPGATIPEPRYTIALSLVLAALFIKSRPGGV